MRLWKSLLTVALVIAVSGALEAHMRGRRDGGRDHRGPRRHGGIYPCLVSEYDTDGDGVLSEEERAAAVEARKAEILAEFDADGDGELSDEERAAACEARKAEREARRAERMAALLEEFDADGDGELSEEERQAARDARKAAILAEFDADGDGELNEEERAAARASRCDRGDMTEEEEDQEAVIEALALSWAFVRGDVNGDDIVDISDSVATLNYLFLGGAAPLCMDAADANDDGAVDIADPTAALSVLFLGGEPLPAPSSEPGEDPTSDTLTCEIMPSDT